MFRTVVVRVKGLLVSASIQNRLKWIYKFILAEHRAYIYSIMQARFYKPFTFNSK